MALYDDFQSSVYSLVDGQTSPDKKWHCLYTGYGTAKIVKDSTGRQYFNLSPKVSIRRGQTHAVAVQTTTTYKDVEITVDVCTLKQLRTGSPANNWETAWLDWNYIDEFHYYGFVLKIKGCQIEKKDNDTQDDSAEIYLFEGAQSVKMGVWQKWRIRVTGTATGKPTIQIWIDGVQIANYTDNKPNIQRNSPKMLNGGHIVLYTEDASVGFDNVNIGLPQ